MSLKTLASKIDIAKHPIDSTRVRHGAKLPLPTIPRHVPRLPTQMFNVWINVNDIPVSLVAAVLNKSAVSTVETQIMEIENP